MPLPAGMVWPIPPDWLLYPSPCSLPSGPLGAHWLSLFFATPSLPAMAGSPCVVTVVLTLHSCPCGGATTANFPVLALGEPSFFLSSHFSPSLLVVVGRSPTTSALSSGSPLSVNPRFSLPHRPFSLPLSRARPAFHRGYDEPHGHQHCEDGSAADDASTATARRLYPDVLTRCVLNFQTGSPKNCVACTGL